MRATQGAASSAQATDRSLPGRPESSFPPLGLLSPPNPLRWASAGAPITANANGAGGAPGSSRPTGGRHVWRPYGCGRMISAPTASAQAADRSLPRKRESSFPPLGLLLPTTTTSLGRRGGPNFRDRLGISEAWHRRRPGGPGRHSAAAFRGCGAIPMRAAQGAAAPVRKPPGKRASIRARFLPCPYSAPPP